MIELVFVINFDVDALMYGVYLVGVLFGPPTVSGFGSFGAVVLKRSPFLELSPNCKAITSNKYTIYFPYRQK